MFAIQIPTVHGGGLSGLKEFKIWFFTRRKGSMSVLEQGGGVVFKLVLLLLMLLMLNVIVVGFDVVRMMLVVIIRKSWKMTRSVFKSVFSRLWN